ncbi:uncharacterized protein CEXT_96221 [Caerostris extrusa]|uniref:Uncharacterized protein n=1 Tax=Caerostris extrusa TaxID=172846 RepID=A0AAV4TYS2_CAEEX|nr:uncharacterized protein CEXT_96221 [Caerostris extrusa]
MINLKIIRQQILLIGIFCTLCKSAVLNNPNRNGEIPEENEPKNPRIPYNFEYDTRDKNGTSLFRKETSDGAGKVEGRYGYKDMFGIERIVEYIADENGYRAKIQTNEPGIENRNPAGVEFYTDFSNRNGQELRRYPDNAVESTTKPETTEEEKTNLVAEKKWTP